jgi:hypothetical protein
LSAPSNPYGGAVSTPKLNGSAAAGLDSSSASRIAMAKRIDLDVMITQSAISDTTKDLGNTMIDWSIVHDQNCTVRQFGGRMTSNQAAESVESIDHVRYRRWGSAAKANLAVISTPRTVTATQGRYHPCWLLPVQV